MIVRILVGTYCTGNYKLVFYSFPYNPSCDFSKKESSQQEQWYLFFFVFHYNLVVESRRLIDKVGTDVRNRDGLHELRHVPVGEGASGVDAVALGGSGHAAHDGRQLEPGGASGGVQESLLALEEGDHGALHGVQALASSVARVHQAHKLLGAVVHVLHGGAEEQLIQDLLLREDVLLALVLHRPTAIATTLAPLALATTTTLPVGQC